MRPGEARLRPPLSLPQIVDLDVKRNRNREALRALHKDPEPEGEAGPRALPGVGGEHREPGGAVEGGRGSGSVLSPFSCLCALQEKPWCASGTCSWSCRRLAPRR